MTPLDQIGLWLSSVSYEHSQSKATDEQYKRVFNEFTQFINLAPEEIIQEYENAETNHISERTIKRRNSQRIQQFITHLTEKGLGANSTKSYIGAIMSFYKYNDLPLGHIPQAKSGVIYHNKDITKDEINKIMAVSPIREKAFFAIMAQSGLRPHTIGQLRIKHLEKILEPDTPKPCKITVPKEIEKGKYGEGHPTFIAEEAIKYTKQYLNTRTNLNPESLLFNAHTINDTPIDSKDASRTFRKSARKLQQTGAISYKIREGKPSELRLYNLRKYFRKYANQMGFEHVNYLMNHVTKGSDNSYTPHDDEWYRKLYEEQAMPFLRFETPTPTETTEIITTLKIQHQAELDKRDKENQELKKELQKQQQQINNIIKMFENLKTGEKIGFELITDENYKEELVNTPEENQINLSPEMKKLRDKLIQEKTKPAEPKS